MAKAPRKITDPAEARRIYERARESVVRRVADPAARQRALVMFDSDPRTQAIRKVAGMPAVTTKRQELKGEARKQAVRETARQVTAANRNAPSAIPVGIRDMGASLIGSVNDSMFGLPARAAAAITGTDNDLMQEFADAQGRRAPVTNFLGTLAASIGTGTGLVRGGGAIASRLAASGAPAVARTGQTLQSAGRAMTIQRGQNVKNVGRLAAGGAAVGGATEAGKGRDVVEGAALGAGGSVALGAGVKVGGLLAGKVSDVLRTTGANAFIRRYTTTTREELQRRAADFRQRTGTEPTFYELLSARDRQTISKQFGRIAEDERERAVNLARDRVASAPSEVAQVVRNATRDQRRQNVRTLADAQATARGDVTPTMPEARLAVGAADNPTRLAQLRRDEARAIMAPFDNQQGAQNVRSLIPTELRALDPDRPGELTEVEIDPEIGTLIRSAAGLARIRDPEQGLTVREVSGMISKLREIATSGSDPIQRGNAQRAVDHLEDQLALNVPGVRPALERMNAAFAARSRQLEGMREVRPQADVDPSTSQRLRRSENVFESPEGAVGRQSGQRSALIEDLERRPDVALGTVRNLADDQTLQRQVRQNIGAPATERISSAAQAQSEGIQNLATAIRDPDFDIGGVTSGDIATVFAGLSPGSMVQTKGRMIATLWEKFGESLSPARSRTIVDMLFSRDPAMTQRAIEALRAQGRKGNDAIKDMLAIAGGATAAVGQSDDMASIEGTATDMEPADPYAEFADPVETDEIDEFSEFADPVEDDEFAEIGAEEGSSPYAADLEALFATEDPALLDLIGRVSQQESRGRQFDSSGQPITSSAGAIGVMQVMPRTGPEAAEMAGLPWDENAYRNDEAYNKLIGTAYLSEMLRRYDGDVELALVAYNAGPGRADAYKSGKISFSKLPDETKEYVRRIMK